VPARGRPISLSAIHQIMEEVASLDWGNIMGQGSSSTFQRTTNFQNGLKLRIRAAFDRTCAQREVFYACVVNRIKVNSGSWLGKKIFDIASHALSDIACSDAVPFSAGFSRARWLFARAHGRPDGVPGGILGAREKSLRRTERRRPCRRNKGAIQNWLCNRRER